MEAAIEKPGTRPEKAVYAVTEKGKATFQNKLVSMLDFEYRPVYPSDSVFYFSEHLERRDIVEHLKLYIDTLQKIADGIAKHKSITLQYVPEDAKTDVLIIFSHHEHHYQSELQWANEALSLYCKEK